MKLYSENENYKLYQGNMLDMLEVIEPSTIDSIVTDPPYELNFMSKGWDNAGVSFQKETWQKCYEVLKPGGYLLAFGGSRTFHRIAVAIEDAGFEIRDTIMWLYGSGFPKSMNVGLAIDKKLGLKRKIKINPLTKRTTDSDKIKQKKYSTHRLGEPICTSEPISNLAKQWQGWGTCLKPSFEPIIVARKPFKGSLVDNVIENGVGGINIDECRIEIDKTKEYDKRVGTNETTKSSHSIWNTPLQNEIQTYKDNGRFPANTILTYDETDFNEVCGGFPNTKSGGGIKAPAKNINTNNATNFQHSKKYENVNYVSDSGSASRYFYCAKASKRDRDEGCQELEDTVNACSNQAIAELKRGNDEFSNEANSTFNKVYKGKNTHPTVKPTSLMQYLVRLVTPNGGTILDPFNGSGSTGKAVMYENHDRNKNYKYIGIELTEEYLPIAKARIEYVCNLKEEKQTTIDDFIGGGDE